MKATELRICNWIQTPRGKKSINGLGFKDTVVSSKDYYATFNEMQEGYFLEHCEPIKLSEEILLKCGFEIKDYERPHISITYYDYNGFILDLDFQPCGDLCVSINYKLEFLHQLQNLIHAITNEELTVNL